MKSIYDVVGRDTAEVIHQEDPAMPYELRQLGCSAHEFARDGQVLYCTRVGCSVRLYPGALHYARVATIVDDVHRRA